jgi:glyoxylase I family protein
MASTIHDSKAPTQPDVDPHKRLQAVREHRRAKNRIARLHHNAIRTDDMEATRHFYEDMLGLPLVSTLKMGHDATTGKPTPYLHCFFEMGDGSMIAFFLIPHRDKAPPMPQDAFDHHLAVKVASFDDLIEIKQQFEAHNYPTCGINHGFCYSLYVRDPNKMMVEIVADPPNELEINEGFAAAARADWLSWQSGDRSSNQDNQPATRYPLPTSSVEEMQRVMPADRS